MSERRQRFILALFIAIFLFLLGLTEREAKGAELDAAVGTSHSVVDALGLDARAAGLGWAVTAVDLGAPGQNFNPASMALATERQLYLGHVDWVLDTSLSQSLALMPMAGGNVVGLGLLYFDQGTVDEVLDDGSYTGERLGARDLHFSLGLGHRFVTGVSVGARFTVFQKTLGWERASGMTGDLGVLTDDMGGFRLGAAVQAMGPPLRFRETEDPAPLRYFAEKHFPDAYPRRLRELYAQPAELFLVRDFRDMFASMRAYNLRKGYGDFGRAAAADDRAWIATLRQGLQALLDAWRERGTPATLVRYEDLVRQPEAALPPLLSTLGLAASPEAIARMLSSAVPDAPDLRGHGTTASPDASIGRWQADLPPELQQVVNAEFGELLTAFGYARA